MKVKSIALLIILFVGALSANAQRDSRPQGSIEDMKKERAAFLVKEMGLTDAEAKTFIPLVDQFMAAKFENYKDFRNMAREIRKTNADTSSANYNKAIDAYLQSEEKSFSLEKEFYKKMRAVLPAEKVYKYRKAENTFMNKMLDKHKEQGEGRGTR